MALIVESPNLGELCTVLGESEKVFNQLVDLLQEWLKSQPHLPKDVPRGVLENFILGTKMSLEQAKKKLDMFFTMKRLVPELYANRDPRDASMTRLHEMMQVVYLPKLTPDNYRVCIFRPIVNELGKFSTFDKVKYTLMIEDILMNESHSLGNIYIADQTIVTLGLLANYTPAIIKKCEVTLSEAYAKRIKAIHCINAAPLTQSLLTLLKKVLKPKLASRIHVHLRGDYESLHQHIPKSMLPKDYGGEGPPMADLAYQWRRKLDEKRDWFLEQQKMVADERLRPGPAIDGDNLFGFSGSFRKLDVD